MSLELVRALFPSWNFYDRVGFQLGIEVQQNGSTEWQPLHFRAVRTLAGFFINPGVTRLHAEVSLLENFVQDVQKHQNAEGNFDYDKIRFLTTFKMVRSLVMNRLMIESESDFQFRVNATAGEEQVQIFVSEPVEAEL